jgi:hypothetical protein
MTAEGVSHCGEPGAGSPAHGPREQRYVTRGQRRGSPPPPRPVRPLR